MNDSAEESAEVKHVEVDGLETAPNTDDVVANDDEVDVTASVEERSVGGGCIIAGSAWDEDGVGIGGVAIKIPEEAREELAEAIRGGEDGE